MLERMLHAIGHRGPDSLAGSVGGNVAMGCARLSIVDQEGGTQPRLSDDRRVIAVFNGEIFNYLSLKAELEGKGDEFVSNSEIETLLKLYLHEGPNFVSRIKGQFAIAIWDGRTEKMFLFRDRFGIRPLFWSRTGDAFVFGSEAKALFASGLVQARLNRKAVLQTFRFWTVVGDSSAFEDVYQLPPAHYAVCTRDGVTLKRYWSWDVPGSGEVLQLTSDEEYFEAFAAELRASVDRQRMSDVPVGSYLSGGIDSSALAMLLNDLDTTEKLRTYSVSFEDSEYDESSFQAIMARQFGFDHVTVHVHNTDISEAFPQVVWQAETMLFRTAPIPLFLLSRRVHSDGCKLVMSGEGADEVLLGYDLFREVAIRRFWGRNPDSEWRGKLFQRLYAYLPQYRNPRYINMIMEFYRGTLKDPDDPHYAMSVRWKNGDALADYFGPSMHDARNGYDSLDDLERWLPEGYDGADDIERAQVMELQTLLGNYLLSSQGDRMSLAHGVEGRYPYLDEDFIGFVATLPRSVKLRGLREKFVLRQAFRNVLPDEIVNRPKIAYQAPDLKGFFHEGRCADYVEELLRPERIKEQGFFDADMVGRLVDKGKSFKLSRVGIRDNMAFTLVLSTMLMDEIFVRGGLSFRSAIETPARMEMV